MIKIRLLGPDDQDLIDKCVASSNCLPFDVCDVYNRPLSLINIPTRVHSTAFQHYNSIYAYPAGQDPTVNNLVPYNSVMGPVWSVLYEPETEYSNKYGMYVHNERTTIMRNGQAFLTIHGPSEYSLTKAISMINSDIPEHPLNLNFRGYEKNMIGIHVRYKGKVAFIKRYYMGEANVLLDTSGYGDVKLSIFSKEISY